MAIAKYSDVMCDWLVELGFTHCFFVAGGNVMHFLESASRRMTMVPVVHEVAAGIAAEYFNQFSDGARAFALVTAGPGLTNIVTALAGAYLESRELLVIGGQVKVVDLNDGKLRQRGIQEIDGTAIAKPVSVAAYRIENPVDRKTFSRLVQSGNVGRKGPVFIELPLDVQARRVDYSLSETPSAWQSAPILDVSERQLEQLADWIRQSQRPVLLIGGGVSRFESARLSRALERVRIPILTTWNGADRISSDHPLYFGRPNTWGQRSANLILQQADLLIALGTRLGMQQTGFNWQKFVPVGRIIQIDCDPAELSKGHPKVDWALCGDANRVLKYLSDNIRATNADWVRYCQTIKQSLPLNEASNVTRSGYWSPYEFCLRLSALCQTGDQIVPCSSGSAFTVMMQSFQQKADQVIVTNKGLASMGYGLSGAIGAAMANKGRRTVLVEGDGGFTQNLQELGTVAVNKLNIKIFIFDDGGYASIRMTQKNYFSGRYVGCDLSTGLGIPDWEKLFTAYGIECLRLKAGSDDFVQKFNEPGPYAFIVPIDPEQTYFPKISSRVLESGAMESNPLHLMHPPLNADQMACFGKYLPKEEQS